MSRPPRILISAGEASGDRLGAGLARAIARRQPGAEISGMGGDEMAEAGVRIVQDASEVAVVGIVEVLRHLPAVRRAMGRLENVLERDPPDVLVPVDFPDFNLRLCARAYRAGVPVVYFVSPQVWAWRRGRLRAIRRLVRRMLVLFPFEADFYRTSGVAVSFVGHPGVERPIRVDRAAVLRRAGLDPDRDVVALLPGSRAGEVSRILPRLLGAAAIVRRKRPEVQFLVPWARGLDEEAIATPLRRAGVPEVVAHRGDYPEVLAACSAGAVASGTATLDAALAMLPMVVVYRMQPLSYALARTMVRVDSVAMPNLVVGRRLVPELIQGACTPARIAEHLLDYLDSPDRSAKARAELAEVRRWLGGPGVFDRAAERILAEIRTGDREESV